MIDRQTGRAKRQIKSAVILGQNNNTSKETLRRGDKRRDKGTTGREIKGVYSVVM